MTTIPDELEYAIRTPSSETLRETTCPALKSHPIEESDVIPEDNAASCGDLDGIEGVFSDMPLRQSVTNALPDGWRVASIDIRHEVKRTIVKAYTDLHTRGIMHGNVRLDNILLHDNQVTLVSLESAATIYRRKGSNLPLCSEADLEEEMLKLKHLLRYEDDRLLDHASEETVGSEDLAKVAHIIPSGLVPPGNEAKASVIDSDIRRAGYAPASAASTSVLRPTPNPAVQLIRSPPIPGLSNSTSPTNARKRRREEADLSATLNSKSVAFHPDTLDNGIWATGKKFKKCHRRTPSPGPGLDDDDSYGESIPDEDVAAQIATATTTPTPQSSRRVHSVVTDTSVGDPAYDTTPMRIRPMSPPTFAACTIRISAPQSAVEPVGTSRYTPRMEPWDESSEAIRTAACYGPPRAIVVTSPGGVQRVWKFPQNLLRQITAFLGNQVSRLSSSPASPQPREELAEVTTGTNGSRKRKSAPEDDYSQHLGQRRPEKRIRALHTTV